VIRIVTESKQDIQKFRDKYGDELTDDFLAKRKQFKSPYNDIYFWLKDNPFPGYELDDNDALEYFLTGHDPLSLSNNQLRKKAKEGAKTVYFDDEWLVLKINTYQASNLYGKNTKWCISGNYEWDDSELGRGYWFAEHNSYGFILFFINKKTNEKFCGCYDKNNINSHGTVAVWTPNDGLMYERGWWDKYDVDYFNITNSPKIEYDGIKFPYIEYDENTGEQTFYN